MWEYIVMGQIPGTRFQVDFTTWLLAVLGMMSLWFLYKVLRAAHGHQFLMALRVSYIMQTASYMPLLATRHHIQA